MKFDCKKCFNCKAVIPLSFHGYDRRKSWTRPGPRVLYGKLQYDQARIRCAKGMWITDSTGEEKVYESGLENFMAGGRRLTKMESCEHFEI